MEAGRQTNYKITIAAGATTEQTFTGTEPKTVVVVPSAGSAAHMLFIPASAATVATATDLMVPADGLTFEIGRGLDRISVFNSSGGSIDFYIAVLD